LFSIPTGVRPHQFQLCINQQDEVLVAFFNLRYVVGPPWNSAVAGGTPNVLAYPAFLLGLDDQLLPPGVGLVGLLSAAALACRPVRAGIFGRAVLATTGLLLLVYVPYFYRAARFLLGATSLLAVAASVALVIIARRLMALGGVRASRAG
jgi:hypothetical protein